MQNKMAHGLAIAAFICSVLAFVFPFLLLLLPPIIEDSRYGFGYVVSVLFVLSPPVLMITGILLIIVAIRIRESRGEGLAIGAFFCSSFPLVHIIYFCYFLLSGKADFPVSTVLLTFPFVALPLGIIAVALAIIALIGRELRGKTLAVVAVVIGILEIVPGVRSLQPEWRKKTEKASSCGPYIYSFDGKEYMCDSEPYAGAILIEQTRYSELNHLVSVNGQYQLKMTNELNETQYTDELKLLVVEHPIGTGVVAEVTGQIHTIASPVRPSYACELPGTDVLRLISEKDNRFWESRVFDKGPSIGRRERRELMLEFPKPQDAKKAKLVMNVSNTLLSSSLAAEFLACFGNWYPAMSAVRSWARKGFIRFEVQAWEDGGWRTKGWIRGASPHLPKDQVTIMDVGAIAGECLKLRLMPAAGFWQIDSAIVDYSEDLPVTVTELEASEAVNHTGQDIREALKADDDNFYVAEKGDYAMIAFNEPPLFSSGIARSFILRAKGYYRIYASNVKRASATWSW